jgi:outer membrane receptor for monomeric catechols
LIRNNHKQIRVHQIVLRNAVAAAVLSTVIIAAAPSALAQDVAGLPAQLSVGGMFASADWIVKTVMVEGGSNSYLAAYTTYGAFVSNKVNENLAVRVNAVNLTDKHYHTAAYRSGAFAYVSDGRTIRATLSGKFWRLC